MKKTILKITAVILICIAIIGAFVGVIAIHDKNLHKELQDEIKITDLTVELKDDDIQVSVNEIINASELNCDASFENGQSNISINARTENKQSVKIIVKANGICLFDKELKYDAEIIVEDTIAPAWVKSVDEIKVTAGDSVDIKSNFKAEDLSGEVEIQVQGNIDTDKVGEQKIKVIATDIYGNSAEKEVNIIVEARPEKTQNKSLTYNEGSSKQNKSSNKNDDASNASNSTTSSSSSSSSSGSSNSSSSSNSGSSSSSSHQHTMPIGNMGRWFSSKNELISYYNSVVNSWNNKVDSGEISNEEYFANVPMGYECWSCSSCGKWTGNFKYR